MDQTSDFVIPPLKPDIKIYQSPNVDGEPTWTIHDPSTGQYFKIDWLSFELLSRLSKFQSPKDIIADIEKTTTLRPTLDDVYNISVFLGRSGLINGRKPYQTVGTKSFLSKLVHGYLYFSIPLMRPQKFLDSIYPKISFLFSGAFIKMMAVFLGLMILWTIPRIDEFLKSYISIFTWEGAVITFSTLLFVKIVHEFSHALTATKYNVNVPHMGVVFMVLYPVLYTETTDSWKLPSSKPRFHIGMAGIVAELVLAAIFLLLWHITPAGTILQSICFFVVVISLAGSLLINLNPLMRFDGYYMLSDATGIDNLQHRSTQFARWNLRKKLFGLKDQKPEILKPAKEKFLVLFGYALIVYRFFLFLGIALLVYHLFFKPLGLVLMMIELAWFIGLPAYSELKVWWKRRTDIMSSSRALTPLAIALVYVFWLFVPWSSSISVPAMVHAGEHHDFYPPYSATLISIYVQDGQKVEEGELLATLQSTELDYRLSLAKNEWNKMIILKSRASTDPVLMATNPITDEVVERARLKLESIEKEKEKLVIKAPISGVVRNMNNLLKEGQTLSPSDKILSIVNPDQAMITAYVTEGKQQDIEDGQNAVFIPAARFSGAFDVRVEKISMEPLSDFSWRELFTPHGGMILADMDPESGTLSPRRTLYELVAKPQNGADISFQMAERGFLKLRVRNFSIFHRFIKGFSADLFAENMGLPL